ncbi:Ig-like domain repeat protein [Paenibacillus ginsengarvi]|nr:Ig-like domain repeat protein [Paenibacillus ginsengarvi]
MNKSGKGTGKLAKLLAAALLLAPMLPVLSLKEAQAAGGYEDRLVYVGAKIMNNSTSGVSWGGDSNYASGLGSYNMWPVFYNQAKSPSDYPGIWGKSGDGDYEEGEYDDDYANPAGVYTVDGHFWGVIQVKDVPQLKALAEGGSAKYRVKAHLNSTTSNGAYIWAYASKDYDYTEFDKGNTYSANYNSATSKFEGYSLASDSEDKTVDSGWLSFGVDDYIVIQTETHDAGTQVEDIVLSFGDFDAPVIRDYTFTSDGKLRVNAAGQEQLFLKKNESIQLQYNFSEPVRASNQTAQVFDKHLLYTVPDGNGLETDATTQGMSLPDGFLSTSIQDNPAKSSTYKYIKALPYVYKASDYHHTGNNPIGNGGELETKAQNTTHSMKERLVEADFHDAAGNPLTIANFGKASADSLPYISNRTVNPFDYDHGGYRIIVDAVPPQYTLTGNGITPEILTGLVLNDGDEIEFTVQLTEDTIVKEGWSAEGLYLLLSNGMKAKYVAEPNTGPNTKLWKFKMAIPAGEAVNTPLLKVIALTHEAKGTDTGVIQDYSGNLLMDEANKDRTESSNPSQAVPYTKIDRSQLTVDNTPPEIGFRYSPAGVTGSVYAKAGKIAIDANDPAINVPALDPDQSSATRPSKGIYRPINMTGTTPGDTPEVGLVYYTWSRSPLDPFLGKEGDHFAAIKRYSLTAEQPGEALYPGNTVSLMVANNKTNMIEPPAGALEPENSGAWYLHSWTADMSWDSARELTQYGKMKAFKTANAALWQGWVSEYKAANGGASDTDAEKYADNKAMTQVGNYAEWPLDDFRKDDSNWTYAMAALLLDNKKPSVGFGTVSGDHTPEVKVQLTVADEHSGPGTEQFQWVKPGEEPREIEWQNVPASREITTLNHVQEDGTYQLIAKAADKAGNVTVERMGTPVTVDSAVRISASFAPDTDGSYMRSPDVTFTIRGIQVESVKYALTGTAAAPADYPSVSQSVYQFVYGTVGGAVYGTGGGIYKITADPNVNGTYAVHVKVKEAGKDMYYTYSKLYRTDNEVPVVSFSKTGVSYPLEQQKVIVTVNDRLSGVMLRKYQWLRSGVPAPDKDAAGWLELPADGAVTIGSAGLSPGESADYVLYVLGEDAVLNSAVAHTDTFKVMRKQEGGIPVAADSDLLYLYEEVGNGYTAVVRLNLESVVKEGYKYAVSTDGGSSWSRWLPYSNFIEVKGLAGRSPDQGSIQVRYMAPGGAVSAAARLKTGSASQAEPVYATAAHSTLQPVKSAEFVLELKVPAGIRAVPSASRNPAEPTRIKGNKFGIGQNGVYSFDLTDVADSSRTDTLLVVVDNLDDVSPEGSIDYSMTASTAGHVLARLEASEPVRIMNNDGRSTYTFTENGSFTFHVEDEAGNRASVTADVYNIDRTPPEAAIVRAYAYGDNGSQTFKTIRDGDGRVVWAEGVVLYVEKPGPQAEDFQIVRGANGTVLRYNGEAEFTIADTAGNTSVLSDTITTIVPYLPDPDSIQYEFVDEDGNLLPSDRIAQIGGVKVARGRMKVTVSGHVQAPNEVFLGTVPASDGNGGYTNRISGGDGTYSYSRIYAADGRTTMAISDLLGHVNKVPVTVQGLDNKVPVIALKEAVAFVQRNQPDFNPLTGLGGFTVSDDWSKPENISVQVSGLDLSRIGGQTATYTATDEAGNTATAEQRVYVLPDDGLTIIGNGILVSAAQPEKVLFDTNVVTFQISKYNLMDVGGESLVNEWGTYDVFYQSGIYREGQMKYMAQGLSLEELLKMSYTVQFPQKGWYTLVVRTQEREREFATFFVGNTNK